MPKATRTMYAQATTTRNPSGLVSDETRFGRKIKVLPSGCWEYNGTLDAYGRFKRSAIDGKSETVQSHRFAYETLVGQIPPGHHLHHKCQRPGCVNPDHLEPLTPRDHMLAHDALQAAAH